MSSVVVEDVGNLVTRESAFGRPLDPLLRNEEFNAGFADKS